ncbi:Copia protein [Papilio xuthus]|uniref:Copia protein n=1 Tax=Papilio xuthus TaxID=66420 RepID=A0A194PHT8_PAPXU|nr:Copia protein [Papilio xuthus]
MNQNQQHRKSTERNRTVQAVEINQPNNGVSDEFSGFAFMTGEYNNQEQDTVNKITFLLDSGASDHIINREDLFISQIGLPTPIKISVAKHGEYISATKKGTIQVTTNLGVRGTLENVLFCPEVPHNLLSVSRMQQAGYTVVFGQHGADIRKNGKTIMQGRPVNNLFIIEFLTSINSPAFHLCGFDKNNYKLWHQRLGHMSKNKFLEIKINNLVEDIEQISSVAPDDQLCEACINGKQSRLPFNQAKDKSYIKRPLYNIHSDVCGPITPTTVDNKNYFVLFVDEYTHYCVTYLLTYKSDVFSAFKDFVAKSEAKFNTKVVNLYSDNGREYLSTEMKNYCVEKGITYHLTVPRTPQQNGVSERMVRTITEKARSLINGAQLDKVFWGYAVLTAVYLINLTPTKSLKSSQTPYELWHNKKPQIKYLKVFGSTVYVHNKTCKSKFEEKSWKGIMLGYEPNGYKVWDPASNKCVVVRDVVVDETNFLISRPLWKPEENVENSRDKTDVTFSKSVSNKSRNSDGSKSDVLKSDDHICPSKIRKTNHDTISIKDKSDSVSVSDPNQNTVNSELRRSDRLKDRPPISYRHDDDDDYLMCAQSVVCEVPSSFLEIRTRSDRSQWEGAINDELKSHAINKTWTLVPRPQGKNIVDCKWIFTVKNDEFGKPSRYKARLVARGFSQQYLTDYDETFAPVARIATFRFLMSFAIQHNLLVHHMDVKTAFLNGKLQEEIYMKIPEGVTCNNSNFVCKLNKALYGLKQAARCWFETFEQSLKREGFQNSSVDRCLYVLNNGDVNKNIYVVLYVDDLVISCSENERMQNFKRYLMSKFKMTDLNDIKLFLGIKITRSENEISFDQSAYINRVLDKFNMQDCKPVNTPLESKLNYEALNSDVTYNAPCRNVIGCLMYIMICTRPDLSTCVNILSRYTKFNNKELWQCLKRVLRYLKGTINLKLCYKRSEYNHILSGYVDSDWGGQDTRDRKSTTGYLFKAFDICTITWSTRKQMSVAASSTEAEYMALYEAVREALWLKSLAVSMHICIDKPIVIFEDNNGCISIANNPTNHKRTKHIDIKYHFSREQIEKNVITLNYIPTGRQLADALTKPLPAVAFHEMRRKMGLE